MRPIIKTTLALAFVLVACGFALAEKGGNGNGNNGEGIGNSGSSANTHNGRSGGNGNAHGQDKTCGADVETLVIDEIFVVPNDQQVASDAVHSKAALSLEAITAIVNRDSDGRILDVQLVTFRGTYLYDVTVLEANGVLHKLYYARSGARVRSE